jgi:hypothetical protein
MVRAIVAMSTVVRILVYIALAVLIVLGDRAWYLAVR